MDCSKCKKPLPEGAVYCPWCGKKQAAAPRKHKKRVNGQGSIIKKPGNRAKPWEAQKDGVYIGCFVTKFEAEQALSRLADNHALNLLGLTFRDVYARWLPEHSRTISQYGVQGYECAFKHCTDLHDKVFRELRTTDFQAVINSMENRGLAKSTCEKVVQLFGQLSKWAIREEICHTNYAQFVTILAKQKSEKVPFTPTQIRAIQASAHPAAQIALILLATGCRPNELFSASTANCHEGYFISGSKTEAGKNRIIPVSPIGAAAYEALHSAAAKKALPKLIDAYTGNHTYANFAKRDWKELMASVGIEGMTPYSCRHTYATMAVQAGVKPEVLQKILGHADYSTTVDVYTHLGLNEILKAAVSVNLSVTGNE